MFMYVCCVCLKNTFNLVLFFLIVYLLQSSLEPEDEARGTNILDLNKENKIFNKEEKVLNTEEKDLKKEEKFVLKGEKKKLCVTEEEIQKEYGNEI